MWTLRPRAGPRRLPWVYDSLTWRLMGFGPGTGGVDRLVTDRSEASGAAYWSPETGQYCMDLFEHAFGKNALLPRVFGPLDSAGLTGAGIPGIPAGIPIGGQRGQRRSRPGPRSVRGRRSPLLGHLRGGVRPVGNAGP